MAIREAIDWIADGFEAELRKRGITGVVVKRDYRCTGRLSNANLAHANLTGANLTGATLDGANLYDANLTGANLTNATLDGANLTGAVLDGADMTGAVLDGADMTGATYSTETRWPDGFDAKKATEEWDSK